MSATELRTLIGLAQSGDISARNELVERNMGLVARPATWYARRNPGIPMDDLLQVGRIGVIRAVEKFDIDAGYTFSTYATYWIQHELRRLVRIMHARGVSATMTQAAKYVEGRMACGECERCETDPRMCPDVRQYEIACLNYISMDSPATRIDSEHSLIRDVIPDHETDVEQSAEIRMLARQVFDAFERGVVSRRGQLIIIKHYGLDGNQPVELSRIAAELGSKTSDVRDQLEQSLRDLRLFFGESE